MADKFPMPGQNDFSADEERSMRAGARADNARLSQVAPEFAPAAAQDAREGAASRTSNRYVKAGLRNRAKWGD